MFNEVGSNVFRSNLGRLRYSDGFRLALPLGWAGFRTTILSGSPFLVCSLSACLPISRVFVPFHVHSSVNFLFDLFSNSVCAEGGQATPATFDGVFCRHCTKRLCVSLVSPLSWAITLGSTATRRSPATASWPSRTMEAVSGKD